MKISPGISCVVVVAACVTAWLLLANGPTSAPAGVGPVPEALTEVVDASPVAAVGRESAPVQDAAGLAFARSFWGDRWPEIEADFRARGKLRDWKVAPTASWEEAEKEFAEKLFPLSEAERTELIHGNLLQWHGQVDAEWLREVIGANTAVTPDQVTRIQDVVERHNGAIEPFAQEWAERLDFEIRGAWRARRYEHGPFSLPKGVPGPYIWSSAQGYEGWTARMSLTFEDCPGLSEMLQRIRRMVTARNAEVSRIVHEAK